MTPSSTSPVDHRVAYRVLGQVTALANDTSVGLGGRKQRLVLAVLLANPGEVVTQDSLIEAVWNGSTDAGGPRTLHTYVSLLRKVLGGEIERDGSGYRVVAGVENLDSVRFAHLTATARDELADDPAAAASILREALALWHGDPYGDLSDEPALLTDVNRLNEARLEALEMRFEADLALGRHREITSEVETLLHEQPYREHLAAIQMLALYRSERQAEALRVYRDMRSRLVEELGVEPGTELQTLEQQILEHDASISAQALRQTTAARSYEVHDIVDTSPFGTRYRGFEKASGREVLLLELETPSRLQSFIRRFDPEMESVAKLEHPHLLPIRDHWRDPSAAFVVTTSPRGGPLARAFEKEPISLTGAVRMMDQLALAVDFLHRQDRVHGAISVHSVMLDEEHNAYLADTGLADLLTSPTGQDDTYQLAELLCTMLRARPGSWRPDLPADLEHAVARALHPEPTHRFTTAEHFARAVRQSAGVDVGPVPGPGPERFERRNPYKGLRAFQESDSADFHGRDSLIDEVLEAVTRQRLVSVVGPSGSGKSSVVRAGVLPRLRNEPDDLGPLFITDMYPGAHPFESLEIALERVAQAWEAQDSETLRSGKDGLREVVARVIPPGYELLLLVDQFEEVFSLVDSPSERDRFLGTIVDSTTHEASRVRIVLTLRADFFDQPLADPDFAEPFRNSVIAVSPPTRDGLTRAIGEPAARAGVTIEPGLTARIVDDVMDQPGGLPLLQFALSELFTRQSDGVLTAEAYTESGGVAGTLGTRAEQTYRGLSASAKEASRQMFLRLVTVDDFSDDTRRRVPQAELFDIDVGQRAMVDAIQQYGSLRFLTFDRDPKSRAPTVELAHEAILREWPRLQTWIDERRADLLIHRRVQIGVTDWRENDHDPAYLLRGGQLDQARSWLERTDIAVTEAERRLIDESSRVEADEQAIREELERRAARRRRTVVGILAVAATVASVLGVYAFRQRQAANLNAARAEVRELALAAMAITEDDPELGILLAAEAVRRSAADDTVLPEAMGALWSARVQNRVLHRFEGVGALALAYSPDGASIVVDPGPSDDTITIRDAETGNVVTTLDAPGDASMRAMQLVFSSDGLKVAVARQGSQAGGTTLDIYEVHTGRVLAQLGPGADMYSGVAFSETGLVAGMAHFDGFSRSEVVVWDLSTGEEVSRTPASSPDFPVATSFLTFRPDSSDLVFGSGSPDTGRGVITTVDAPTGAATEAVIDFPLSNLAMSPDGTRVALLGELVNEVVVYDLVNDEFLFDPVPHQSAQAVSFSPDGDTFAVSGNESDVTLFDASAGAIRQVLSGHTASVWATSFHPSGQRLASVSASGETRIWDVTLEGPAPGDFNVGDSDIDVLETTTRFVAPSLRLEGAIVADRQAGEIVAYHSQFFNGTFAARDADLMAGVTPNGFASIVEMDSGEVVHELPDCSTPIAISPDARIVALGGDPISECGRIDGLSGVMDVETGRILVDFGSKRSLFGSISSSDTFNGHRYAAIVLERDEVSEVEVWDLTNEPTLIGVFPQDLSDGLFYLLLSFSTDGRFLGVGTNGERALVIDMTQLTGGGTEADSIVFNRRTHTSNVPIALVTPDGVVATAGFDGFYRHWDVETGSLLFELEVEGVRGHTTHAYSPDYKHYFYEDRDGIIRRMPTDPDQMVEEALASVTRDLTEDECQRYLKLGSCDERT